MELWKLLEPDATVGWCRMWRWQKGPTTFVGGTVPLRVMKGWRNDVNVPGKHRSTRDVQWFGTNDWNCRHLECPLRILLHRRQVPASPRLLADSSESGIVRRTLGRELEQKANNQQPDWNIRGPRNLHLLQHVKYCRTVKSGRLDCFKMRNCCACSRAFSKWRISATRFLERPIFCVPKS